MICAQGNDRTRQSDVAPRRVQRRVQSSLNADLFFLMTAAVRSPPCSKATKRKRRKPGMPGGADMHAGIELVQPPALVGVLIKRAAERRWQDGAKPPRSPASGIHNPHDVGRLCVDFAANAFAPLAAGP